MPQSVCVSPSPTSWFLGGSGAPTFPAKARLARTGRWSSANSLPPPAVLRVHNPLAQAGLIDFFDEEAPCVCECQCASVCVCVCCFLCFANSFFRSTKIN